MKGKHTPTILTCIGALGVITSTILAIKSTPKALMDLEEAAYRKGDDLTKMETIRIAAPSYIPTALSCLATITCIFGANVLNKRRQAALVSAYGLMDAAYKEYRDKIKDEIGEESENRVWNSVTLKPINPEDIPRSGDILLFYDMNRCEYFESVIDVMVSDDGLECYIVDTTPV